MTRTTMAVVETLILELSRDVHQYVHGSRDWRNLDEEELWTELVSCILGSQVTREHAQSALVHLRGRGLLNADQLVAAPPTMESRISDELSRPIYAPTRKDGTGSRFRFQRSKAKQICLTAVAIYSWNGSLKSLLGDSKSDREARARLMRACCGVGPKQASLFLRNVGYSDDLAILDSHVLRFMRKKGLTSGTATFPRSKWDYFDLEAKFAQYAGQVGSSPRDLDMAIWAVMRIADVG